jgi:hypothetical protein
MRWWKVLGLAGFAGVAATGVVIARDERQRRAYTPPQIRERLHARLAETAEAARHAPAENSGPAPAEAALPAPGTATRRDGDPSCDEGLRA